MFKSKNGDYLQLLMPIFVFLCFIVLLDIINISP